MMNLMIARSTFLFYARCRQQRPTLYVRTSNGPTPEPLKGILPIVRIPLTDCCHRHLALTFRVQVTTHKIID